VQPAPCARCGGPNPPGATTCQWCRAALVAPGPPGGVYGSYRPLDLVTESDRAYLSAPSDSPAAAAGLAYRIAIPFLFLGVVLLVVSAVISQQASSFNQACAQNPVCTPESDPSGGVAAGGAVLLLIGIVLVAYGLSRGRGDPGGPV